MAVWLPAQNKFYLPPQPVAKIQSTDDFVTRTSLFYHASSERLLTVGHPLYSVQKATPEKSIPKVSPHQYRVFRVQLANPNNFAFGNLNVFNPEKERLVWALRAVQVNRGQPLGIGVSGSPYYNKLEDVENPNRSGAQNAVASDTRKNVGIEPKQVQLLIVGCRPALGEYWTAADPCPDEAPAAPGDCPPIELRSEIIQDGQMAEVGFGPLDFPKLQPNKADVPLDFSTEISRYPDFLRMNNEVSGDMAFFHARREAMYGRHLFSRAGVVGEQPPTADRLDAGAGDFNAGTPNYTLVPSGSLVSTEAQIFNRPYWLSRAQGQNNGIAWNDELFVTLVDNSRGTTLAINAKDNGGDNTYTASGYKEYSRHVEEYELSFIVQLCKVELSPENLAYIHHSNPRVIERWHLAVNAPSNTLEDTYRKITSLATRCPPAQPAEPDTDPYKDYNFWNVDLTGAFTEQLDQTALGRRFLAQTALYRVSSSGARKRAAPTSRSTSTKRRRGK
ncbi:MAG: late protein 1 [Equus asinus papillomavirus 3]|nr:MAG: late protein 1 [Equus asinus papillomavirus 3]